MVPEINQQPLQRKAIGPQLHVADEHDEEALALQEYLRDALGASRTPEWDNGRRHQMGHRIDMRVYLRSQMHGFDTSNIWKKSVRPAEPRWEEWYDTLAARGQTSLAPAARNNLIQFLTRIPDGSSVVLALDGSEAVARNGGADGRWQQVADTAKDAALFLALKGCGVSTIAFAASATTLAEGEKGPEGVRTIFEAIDRHVPGGPHTCAAAAIEKSCDTLNWKPDTYVLAITDGQFGDQLATRHVIRDAEMYGISIQGIGISSADALSSNFERYVVLGNNR